ncbi:MAG: hypothetical protein ACI9R3_005071, partial [Verrucomicrobiales bacterium]
LGIAPSFVTLQAGTGGNFGPHFIAKEVASLRKARWARVGTFLSANRAEVTRPCQQSDDQ